MSTSVLVVVVIVVVVVCRCRCRTYTFDDALEGILFAITEKEDPCRAVPPILFSPRLSSWFSVYCPHSFLSRKSTVVTWKVLFFQSNTVVPSFLPLSVSVFRYLSISFQPCSCCVLLTAKSRVFLLFLFSLCRSTFCWSFFFGVHTLPH